MDWYIQRMRSAGDAPAVLAAKGWVPYSDLIERMKGWQRLLEDKGITPGGCGVLSGDFSADTAALLLALLHRGQIVAPLRIDDPEHDLKCDVAHAAYEFAFDATGGWEYRELQGDGHHAMYAPLREADDGGLIIYTSGSTGAPKGALHAASRFLERHRPPRPAFRTITFLLLDHIGGLNSLFSILACGGAIVPTRARDPESVARAVEAGGVQLLPTTPTFLKMLLIDETWKRHDLSSLELITYGTEPMPDSTLHAIQTAFPKVRFKQTYGLTELGIMPVRSPKGDSRWFSIGGDGFETRITDGTLRIRARTSMEGYLNAPSPFDAEGWYDTGDFVEERDGYIRVLGRDSEIINVGGEKVMPGEVEDVILRLPNIRDVLVQGSRNPVTGNVVVARVRLVEPEDAAAMEQRVREACARELKPYMVPAMVVLSDENLHGERFKKLRQV